jgi:uncharacterized protein (TIGR02145 family)
VDLPGTFADTPESKGMLYQWNRKVAWSSADPMKAYDANGEEIVDAMWDNARDVSAIWAAENDPCPEGWRLPIQQEVTLLIDNDSADDNKEGEWITKPAGLKLTDKTNPELSLFLPSAGDRRATDGWLYTGSSIGDYAVNVSNRHLYFQSTSNTAFFYMVISNNAIALPVRCVKAE